MNPGPTIIARFDPRTGNFTQIAGGGFSTGEFVPALGADLGTVGGLAVARNGDIYFTDKNTDKLRKVNAATNMITTVAGTGTAGYNGDNSQGTLVQLNNPAGVALDDSGNLYVSDISNYRVRKVGLATGSVITIGGNGVNDYPIEAALATESPMVRPLRLLTLSAVYSLRRDWVSLVESNLHQTESIRSRAPTSQSLEVKTRWQRKQNSHYLMASQRTRRETSMLPI